MKSSYALYLEEREGKFIVEDERGFATYYYPEPHIVYVEDVFVRKEYRRSRLAYTFVDKIVNVAKNVNCTLLLGSVDPKANHSQESRQFVMNYGMKLFNFKNGLEWYSKEIL